MLLKAQPERTPWTTERSPFDPGHDYRWIFRGMVYLECTTGYIQCCVMQTPPRRNCKSQLDIYLADTDDTPRTKLSTRSRPQQPSTTPRLAPIGDIMKLKAVLCSLL
jgi:hypothetical protein